MKGKLVKIVSNHNNLRTSEMAGEFPESPSIGRSFVIFGKPLTEGADFRMIRTTLVKSIEDHGDKILFKTENSEYELHFNTWTL